MAYKNTTFVFPDTLLKKSKQLLIPGLWFSLLTILEFVLVKIFAKESVIQYLLDSGFDLLTLRFPGAMWFLPCYFFAEIIFLLITKWTTNKWGPSIFTIVCFAVSIFTSSYSSYLIRISRLMMAISFIGIGYLLYNLFLYKCFNKDTAIYSTHPKGNHQILKRIAFFGGIIMLAVVAVGSYYNGSVSFEGANYGRNPALYLVNALCGTLGLVFIFFALDMRIPPLEFYGRNTFAHIS